MVLQLRTSPATSIWPLISAFVGTMCTNRSKTGQNRRFQAFCSGYACPRHRYLLPTCFWPVLPVSITQLSLLEGCLTSTNVFFPVMRHNYGGDMPIAYIIAISQLTNIELAQREMALEQELAEEEYHANLLTNKYGHTVCKCGYSSCGGGRGCGHCSDCFGEICECHLQ